MTQKTIFTGFTNLYEISKTLRFELKPVGETEKLLEENQVFLTDKIRQKKYEDIKPFLDEFHLNYIQFCLKDLVLDYAEYKKSLDNYQKDKKNKDGENKKKNEEKKLREQIVGKFDSKVEDFLKTFGDVEIIKRKKDNQKIKVILGKNWEIEFSKNTHEFLFEIGIFDLMKKKFEGRGDIYLTNKETGEIYKNEKTGKDVTIFDDWHGWLGYLTKFFETRKNLYKSDGTSTALATRIIDQNLKKYSENLNIYNRLSQIEELKNKFKNLESDFGIKLEEFFSLENYNSCFLQDGIQKYNEIRGGKVEKNNNKVAGINEYINKYRQDSGEKLPFLQKLDNQILAGGKENFIDQIENEEAFKTVLSDFYNNSVKKVEILTQIFDNLKNYSEDDYKTIYFSKEAFNTLSHKFTDQVLFFESLVFDELLQDKLVEKKDFDKKEEKHKFPDFIPLFYVKKGLEKYQKEELFYKSRYYENKILEENNDNIWEKFCTILNYEFQTLLSNTIINQNGEEVEIGFNVSKRKLEKILENFLLGEKSNGIIKDFADISRTMYQMGKYFALEKKREWDNNFDLHSSFYSEGLEKLGYKDFYNEAYEQIIVPYNLMRNFIAKKPWEDNKKWKLNFENSSLLKGWDKDFESYGAYIFEKNGLYYLGLINGKKLNSDELEKLYNFNSQNIARRFVYDFQKPDNKNTPRLFIRSKGDNFAPAVEELNLPIHSIIDIYDKEFYKKDKKNPDKHKESLVKLIDYFKLGFSKHESYKHFDFVWKESNKYQNIADFYRDVEKSCYKPYWESINFDELKNLTKEKRLYLFQIYNKNFKLDENLTPENYKFKGNGKDSVHTLYFKGLFSEENLQNKNGVNLKLSGGGEIFFRPKAIDEEIDIKRKTKIDVVKNKRYTQEKVFLHFPIQVNFKENKALNFNNYTNKFLANNPNINIIGIDRGEKHLAYYSVINQKEEILESGSLNHIYQKDKDGNIIQKAEKKIKEIRNDEGKIVDYELVETGEMLDYEDYGVLLDYKEKKRRLQRQSWKEVEQIKDLKKGYISAVVRKIADLIIEYNAIVVFEDLNMRFKQIRGGIEKSTYQQLEKALIDKLNFLVNKGWKNPEEAGNLLKAFQLTAPIGTFKDMGKQTGIIFYTQASYTSKIDPITGWRPNLYIKKQSAELNKANILKFDSIIWNKEKEYFEVSYDLEKFQSESTKNLKEKKEEKLNKTKWTVSTCVERYKWNKNLNNNKGGYEHFEDLSQNFKILFEDYGIDISGNILEQIEKLEEKGNEKFFSHFLDVFKLLCQIRNTNEDERGNENDFIYSPVFPFFDSRKENKIGVKNGDDNGAYNIARKGIVILERLNEWKKLNDEKIKKGEKEIYPELFISNIAWDNFTQKNTSKK